MQNYNIRQGEQSDLSWTAKILEAGIDEGHFSKLLKNNSAPLIKAIINKDEIKFVGMRGKIDSTQRYNFDLLIAELNNIAVSFLVLKIGVDGVELHLAGTLKEHRRKGYFYALANHVKEKYTKNTRLYARCYKKSTFAINALEKLGFEKIKDGDPIELELKQEAPISLHQSILKFLRVK